jgi:hypothetical protein
VVELVVVVSAVIQPPPTSLGRGFEQVLIPVSARAMKLDPRHEAWERTHSSDVSRAPSGSG